MLASSGSITLTEEHVQMAVEIELALAEVEQFSTQELATIRTDLIEEFNADPKLTLQILEEVHTDVIVLDVLAPVGQTIDNIEAYEPTQAQERSDPPDSPQEAIGSGHETLRNLLDQYFAFSSRYPSAAFGTKAAAEFRAYVANSRLISSGFNSYSSSEHIHDLCSGGAFGYYYGSSTAISGGSSGVEVSDTLESSALGAWDVFEVDGQLFLIMFSADPGFADVSVNGLVEMPVAHFQQDLIQIGARGTPATPDLLIAREPTNRC